MINVIIVEDNDTIREGLSALINGTEGFRCVATYSNCESLLKHLEDLSPDILLMDIVLPGMSGIDGVKQIKQINPDFNILMLTIYGENDLVFEALCAGACGYLLKNTPAARLLEAIKEAHAGGSPMSPSIARKVVSLLQQKNLLAPSAESILTTREREILNALSQGNNYQAIAESLFISVSTVRFHIRNIYQKLHVQTQSEAVATAIRKGLI
ncbi:response regulator transcription factor [candidate division KSB1 bacterium]|nr:response regulator transcription factor [candidate division KSB1 bacterium]